MTAPRGEGRTSPTREGARIDPLASAGRVAATSSRPASSIAALRDPVRLAWILWVRALRHDRRARAATVVLVGLTALALGGALLPAPIAASPPLLPPSWAHLFGTDVAGRDLVRAVLRGGVHTLSTGVLGALVAGAIGVVAGSVAGVARGTIGALVHRTLEGIYALPSFFLVVILEGIEGIEGTGPESGSFSLFAAIVATRCAEVALAVRVESLRVVELDHVTAARALGAGPTRILLRHVVPSVVSSVAPLIAFGVGGIVILEATLAALGIGGARGVAALHPLAWGSLLGQARAHPSAWWLIACPAALVVLTVGATVLLGEAIRDALDPRLRTHGPA